jgi:elongation factor 2
MTDGRQDEIDRGITIKSTGISMYYEYDVEGNGQIKKYLINLIDSPGHVDFSSEVTAALRVTDGALVVVDYVEGICVQTETVLRQALQELIRPVLMINKVDRAFFELRHEPETIYQNFQRVIENANVVISTYQKSDEMGECQVYPSDGNVAFGSAKLCWAFTLNTFARMYAAKFKTDNKRMLSKLWGDNYFDAKAKKWTTENVGEDGTELQRAFCSMILEPLTKLANSLNRGEKDVYMPLLERLNIKIDPDDHHLKSSDLVKKVLQRWINAADALLEMIILYLPSPRIAQKYRTPYLYEGPLDDDSAKAMMSCDPNGPLMMFISKMVPTSDGSRFYAFGRVFSGLVRGGEKVRILGPNYKPGKNEDCFENITVQKVVIMMGKKIEDVIDVPCGNTCALVGIDKCLLKQGTIATDQGASTIRSMKYSVSPVVRIAVRPKDPNDLPKFVEGLNKMAKADPLVQVISTENEHIVAGCGELHLEICLNDLEKDYAKCEVVKSEPVVPYKETVTALSTQTCLAKSPNKHNKLFVVAEPLKEELVKDIEDGIIRKNDDIKVTARTLIDKYEWDQHDARKLWTFGPENTGPNLLVDQTKAVQFLNEIRDSMENAFQWVTKEGVIAEENMRGVRFNILDVELHTDAVHRGGAQIIPTARRVYYAAEYLAAPRFQEPIYLVDIATPSDVMNGIYQCFSQKRGVVFQEDSVPGTPLLNVKAYLPVAESFGFTNYLRQLTSGQAFPQCVFDHWETIQSDPFELKSKAHSICMEIRKRKGLKQEIPNLADYLDKL